MSRFLRGHTVLASLSVLAAIVSVDGAAASANTGESAATLSPTARGVQLAYADLSQMSPTLVVSAAARMLSATHPKYGKVTVTPEVAAAYRALPAAVRAKLGDPKGGQAVDLAELRSLKGRMSEGTVMCPW